MRIAQTKDLSKTAKKSQTNKGGRAGQRFRVGPMGASGGLSGAQGVQSISHIGALLASQEVDEVHVQQQSAIKHGSDMLTQLDQLKLGILNGHLAPHAVNQLRHSLADKRQYEVQDGLKTVLQQIELRAEVELAKLAKQRSRSV